MMLGLVGVVVGAVLVVVVGLAGRWVVGLPFGARRLSDAVAPWGDAGRGAALLPFLRAAGGVFGWYLGVVLVFAIGLTFKGQAVLDETSMRVHVAAGGPAEEAGIRDGDRIVAVDDESIATWAQLSRVIGAKSTGDPAKVTIERDGARRDIAVRPRTINGATKMLVGPPVETKSMGFGSAFLVGLGQPFALYAAVARSLGSTRTVETVGPVGIVHDVSAARPSPIATAMLFAGGLASYAWPLIAFVSVVFALARPRRTARQGASIVSR